MEQLFLTDIDPDIERKIKKDPLREQVIWTRFASELYPNINTTTGEMKGYIIAALGLEIIDKFRRKNSILKEASKELKKELRNIQVMYEMIIMYMLVEESFKGYDINFLGKDKGTNYYKKTNGNPTINMSSQITEERQILVRQYQLGYVARYRSRLENNNSKIRKELLKVAFGNNLKEVIDFFEEVIKKRYEGIKYQTCFRKKKHIKKNLIEILKIEDNKKEIYIDLLEIKKGEVREYLYEQLSSNNDINAEKLVNHILENQSQKLQKDQDGVKILNKIKKMEDFLVPLNNVFFEVLDKGILKVNEKNVKDGLKKAYEEIKKENEIIDEISKKYNHLYKALENNESTENIAEAIVKDHQKMFEKDKMEAWIKIDENKNIIINHRVKENYEDYKWNNYYFIDVVAHIIRSMDSWRKKDI